MIFYGNIQIPRISGNFDACADSVYQALFPRKKGSLGSRLLSNMILPDFRTVPLVAYAVAGAHSVM